MSKRSKCVGILIGSNAFNSFIEVCKLVVLLFRGKKFTWLRSNNKMSRLDQVLVDEHWLVSFNDLIKHGYGILISDHISILLYNSLVDWGPRPFKFPNAWLDKEECTNLIEEVWGRVSGENTKLAGMLRRLKVAIKNRSGKSRVM